MSQMIDTIALAGSDEGQITVTVIDAPYGEGSKSVASIGVSLQPGNSEPDWKVHIPAENIDAVIAALQEAKTKL